MRSIIEFPKWFITRCVFYLKNRKIPWRLRPVKSFIIALLANPKAALKYRRRYLILRDMSVTCFMLQIFGPRILKETMWACRQADIHPFLTYGSLLGYIRDGSAIDTDNDIDLGIFENEIEKLPQLKKAMLAKGYHIHKDTELEISFQKDKYFKLFIDFWVHRNHKASNTIYSGCLFDDPNEKVSIFPFTPEIFARMKNVNFLGSEVSIPHQPEAYLLKMYGKDWRIPLTREFTFREKTKFIYSDRLKITREEYHQGDFL